MNSMMRLILSFLLLSLITNTQLFSQPCVPNTDTVSGISPDTLAPVYVNIPYEEVIYFRLPADTIVEIVIGTDTLELVVCVDSLTIDSVVGLPAGFSYGCNVPWCAVHGGENGCAVVTGTANSNQAGIYPLNVFVSVYTNDCSGFSLPQQVDTVAFYFLDIQFAQGIPSLPANDFSIGSCYPNPSVGSVILPLYARQSSDVVISVLSLQGQVIREQTVKATAGTQTVALDISSLASGSYFIRAEMEGKQMFEKLEVVR